MNHEVWGSSVAKPVRSTFSGKATVLNSSGNMVAGLALKKIDGRAALTVKYAT